MPRLWQYCRDDRLVDHARLFLGWSVRGRRGSAPRLGDSPPGSSAGGRAMDYRSPCGTYLVPLGQVTVDVGNRSPNMALQRTRGLVAVRSVQGFGGGSAVESLSGGRSPLNAVALDGSGAAGRWGACRGH